jgi:hypothetical protein
MGAGPQDRETPKRRTAQNERNLAHCLGAAAGEMCKTNPISGPIVRNKPNFRRGRAGRGSAKRPGLGQIVQNEPNSRQGPEAWASIPRPGCTNKPNFGGWPVVQTKPIWPSGGHEGRGAPTGAILSNKANLSPGWERCCGPRRFCETKPICHGPRVHHRGTEITEAILDSLASMTSLPFSVSSVPLW